MPVTQPTKSEVYTIEEAEDHIADVRGITDLLTENHPLSDSQVPNTPGVGNGSALYSVGGTTQTITEAGMAGSVGNTQGDGSSTTVTSASGTQLSQNFTIPANDMSVGTAYKLTCFGNGSWGSTPQALTYTTRYAGQDATASQIGSGQFNGSVSIHWWAEAIVLCVTTGASGTVTVVISGTMSQNANPNLAGTGANGSIGWCRSSGGTITVDTTVNQNFQINANWSSTTGAPSITCRGTILERIGP